MTISPDTIRKELSGNEWIKDRQFEMLQSISTIYNTFTNHNIAREFVIRVLHHRNELSTNSRKLLDILVRHVGLYPYIDTPKSMALSDMLSYEFHRPSRMLDRNIVFHSGQLRVYLHLIDGKNVILSAPTSFGKSLIIDAVVASRMHNNIALIVPTIALIDETRKRMLRYNTHYNIITHSQQKVGLRNIFVMTQERILSYKNLPKIDFFALDEFYKLGMESDKERAGLLNLVFYRLAKDGAQFYLLGPNIKEIPPTIEDTLECVFMCMDFNTVAVEKVFLPTKNRAEEVSKLLREIDEPTLIYCKSPKSCRSLAFELLSRETTIVNRDLKPIIEWLSINYHPNWTFIKALKSGIGIHHARIPRAVGQYLIRLFNEGKIKVLICTSTLIEGVNTSAKNVVVYDNIIAKRKLDLFTFNNICGRSGRMFKHFIGKVYLFDKPPEEELPFVDIPAFTQSEDASDELLLQLDETELTDESREKIAYVYNQTFLTPEIIKENCNINPQKQIDLAKAIFENPREFALINWNNSPNYDQLQKTCEVIWKYLVPLTGRPEGARSPKQLAYRINRLQQGDSISQMIQREIKDPNLPDEAVEELLSFYRNWAGFHFPKYLRCLDEIKTHVFKKLGISSGRYGTYADRSENHFLSPILTALEEYGIPVQLSKKISKFIRFSDDLDETIHKIKSAELSSMGLSSFETDLLTNLFK